MVKDQLSGAEQGKERPNALIAPNVEPFEANCSILESLIIPTAHRERLQQHEKQGEVCEGRNELFKREASQTEVSV